MPIAPMNMVDVMGGLAALSAQQESNKQQRIKTKEFLDTHNARVKTENAQLALQEQQASMNLDVAKTAEAEGRHQDVARAADKAAVAKSKESTSKAGVGKKYYDLSMVVDEDSRNRAILEAIQEGVPEDEIASNLGPLDRTWNEVKPFIDVRKSAAERATNTDTTIKAEASEYGADLGYQATQMRTAADIYIADRQFQAAQAAAAAKAASGQSLNLDYFPEATALSMAQHVISAMGLSENEDPKKLTKVSTAAENAAFIYNQLLATAKFDYQSKAAVHAQAGLPPPPAPPQGLQAALTRQAVVAATAGRPDTPVDRKLEGKRNPNVMQFDKNLRDPNSIEARYWATGAFSSTRELYEHMQRLERIRDAGDL